MANLFVGTSGWNYRHWKGLFYPPDLSQKKWLQHYMTCFNCVELNVTFYRLVPPKTFSGWYEKTPQDFHFVVKGSRFITHIKGLKDVNEAWERLINNASALKEKLAAFLWQLPPGLKKDLPTLQSFLKLSKVIPVRQVFEFRHPTWFDSETYHLLRSYHACLCIADSDRFPCVKEVTANYLYLRFHGRESLYGGDYTHEQLKAWSDFIKYCGDKDVFAFFNNDASGYAVNNALALKHLLK